MSIRRLTTNLATFISKSLPRHRGHNQCQPPPGEPCGRLRTLHSDPRVVYTLNILMESICVLCSIYRMPSLACARALAVRYNRMTTAAQVLEQSASTDKEEVHVAADSAECVCEPCFTDEARESHVPHVVDLRSTVYMLNPSGDLPATQAAFETLFRRQPDWQVRFIWLDSNVLQAQHEREASRMEW